MSKSIQLTKGREVLVDDDDFTYLNQWKWWYGADGYACREQHFGMRDGKSLRKTILMHRLIIDAPSGLQVDHINRNKLDNRRSNLRLATQSQNRANIDPVKRRQSELPMGVTYNLSLRSKQPYMARVTKSGKSYFLGNFYTVEEAATAYKLKKRELFGEFSCV